MNATVVLLAYYGDKWIPACVESLAQASEGRLHLVLLNNAGNTVIDELDLSAFDAEVLRCPEPLGFADANNYCLVNASRLEGSVIFLNQDTISQPGWIDACLRCLEEDPSLGAVSPALRTYEDDAFDPDFMSCLPAGTSEHVLEHTDGAPSWIQTDNAPAAALMVRTRTLVEVGPFDPVFGSYYEDYDLCRRIREGGYRIGVCPQARLLHYSGSVTDTPEKVRKRMRVLLRNRLLYQLRERGGVRAPMLARSFGVDMPRRVLRGALRTPSSQPVRVVLGACRDLAELGPRLYSRRRDQAAWEAQLAELGWPERVLPLRD